VSPPHPENREIAFILFYRTAVKNAVSILNVFCKNI
jgi:hypothetical protein